LDISRVCISQQIEKFNSKSARFGKEEEEEDKDDQESIETQVKTNTHIFHHKIIPLSLLFSSFSISFFHSYFISFSKLVENHYIQIF